MSTLTLIPTHSLQESDTLLVGSSMVIVDSVTTDEMDDEVMWLTVTCVSGNFDQFETPLRADSEHEWRVLDAEAR